MTTQKTASVTEFKAHCLKYIDDAQRYHVEYLVTKRGKPVAKLIPLHDEKYSFSFGDMKESITIKGDLLLPLDIEWNAQQ